MTRAIRSLASTIFDCGRTGTLRQARGLRTAEESQGRLAAERVQKIMEAMEAAVGRQYPQHQRTTSTVLMVKPDPVKISAASGYDGMMAETGGCGSGCRRSIGCLGYCRGNPRVSERRLRLKSSRRKICHTGGMAVAAW